MRDQRIAGQKADATRVVAMLAARYRNPAKDAIRTWVIRELATVEPALVLDLWGGGGSADQMTVAGLSVLSVDDGRDAVAQGVSATRSKRALTICAEAGGYRAGWGSPIKYAPECDAAWLDFMGHLCGETVRILKACRHMKALAITLMPDRMAGVQNLPVETWVTMYSAAVAHHAGLRVRTVRRYRREGGQWVLVLFARRYRNCPGPSRMALRAAQARSRLVDPEIRAQANAQAKAHKATPEYRARVRAYKATPEQLARARERSRAWYANPDNRPLRRAYLAERRRDPASRAARKAYQSAWRARKKAEAAHPGTIPDGEGGNG